MSKYGDSNFIKKIELEDNEYLIPSSDHYHQFSGRYYVDGINGDDSNDGLTSETSFKTLERFLDILNSGILDARCYILSAGTYTITKTTIEGCVLHITANVGGVIIKYSAGGVFYNSHLNLKGVDSNNHLTITTDAEDDLIYFENCAVSLEHITFTQFNKVSFIGGFVNSTDCSFTALWTDGTNGEFYDTIISRPDINQGILIRRSSNIIIRNNLTFGNYQTSYNLISVERSKLIMYHVTLNNNSQITTGTSVYSRSGIIQSTTGIINNLDSIAQNNHDFGAITLWITTNATIPT